jgi:hypothetical protein
MRKVKRNYRRTPSWKEIAQSMERFGWYTEQITKDKFVLEKGRERVVAKRFPHTNKWEVEAFNGRLLEDTTGAETESFAKRLAAEMAFLRSF